MFIIFSETNEHTKPLGVQPIVGADIQRVKNYLMNRPQRYKTIDFNLRDYTMFCVNINFGMRITDFLTLKIEQILDNGEIADAFCIEESKNKVTREIPILPEVKNVLKKYLDSIGEWKPDWYLFFPVWPQKTPYKAMTRQNMLLKMKDIENELEFNVPIGTHSMRKTFARGVYDALIQTDPMALIVVQKMLGHRSPDTTLTYIGLNREMLYNKRIEVGYI